MLFLLARKAPKEIIAMITIAVCMGIMGVRLVVIPDPQQLPILDETFSREFRLVQIIKRTNKQQTVLTSGERSLSLSGEPPWSPLILNSSGSHQAPGKSLKHSHLNYMKSKGRWVGFPFLLKQEPGKLSRKTLLSDVFCDRSSTFSPVSDLIKRTLICCCCLPCGQHNWWPGNVLMVDQTSHFLILLRSYADEVSDSTLLHTGPSSPALRLYYH